MEFGKKGEEAAVEYLEKQGYEILQTNYRFGHAEIDIVARNGNEIVFVEVKTRKGNYLVEPRLAVTVAKQKNVIRAASAYIQHRNISLDARFDIIAVVEREGQLKIDHIKEAFYPTL